MFGLWNTEPEEVLSQKDVTKLAYTRFFIFFSSKKYYITRTTKLNKKTRSAGKDAPTDIE